MKSVVRKRKETSLARFVGRGLIAFIPALLLASCSGVDEIEWKEQVRLHNGTVIEVERRATRGGFLAGIPRSNRGPEYSYEICYRPMGVYWNSNAPYAPHVFDIVEGKPTVAIRLGHCMSCEISGYPELSVVAYQLDRGSWHQIKASTLPKTIGGNVLRMFWDAHEPKNDVRGTVTLDQKRQRDRGLINQNLWQWMESQGRTFCEECRKHKTEFVGGKQPTILRERGNSKFCL